MSVCPCVFECLWCVCVYDTTKLNRVAYIEHSLLVPGQDSAQVDELTGDTELVLCHLCHLPQHVHLRSPANQCDVTTCSICVAQVSSQQTSDEL